MSADACKKPRRRLHAKKATERAILGEVCVLNVIDDDGVVGRIKAIVGHSPLDRKMMNDRGLNNGDILVMDLFKERHNRFWGLWHKLGEFLANNVDELAGMTAHDALKKVQLTARIYCQLSDFELEDGQVLRHWTTKSLNFADTDESTAQEVWTQLCDKIAERYFPDWTSEQVSEAAEFWERQQA